MINKMKLFGVTALMILIGFSVNSCSTGNTDRDTMQVTINITNENSTEDITTVSIWTLSASDYSTVYRVGTGFAAGASVGPFTLGETYTAPNITISINDDGIWMLGINVNDKGQPSSGYPNLLDSSTPPSTLNFQYTSTGDIVRVY